MILIVRLLFFIISRLHSPLFGQTKELSIPLFEEVFLVVRLFLGEQETAIKKNKRYLRVLIACKFKKLEN